MLVELAVRDLGVIEEARIQFSEGMTALTGETGAGKTMVVEALRLLSGAKADTSSVRQGAGAAVVEALFELDDTEWAIRRIVPAGGRSRCYLNGELVAASQLADLSRGLLEIHGQHSQQALLDRRHQREALDRFAGADSSPVHESRRLLAALSKELESLGGDERARQRQLDLLAHQVTEIEAVAPTPGEEAALAEREDRLARAVEYQQSAAEALELLGAEGAAQDLLARAEAAIADAVPLRSLPSDSRHFSRTCRTSRVSCARLPRASSPTRSNSRRCVPGARH